MIPYTDGNIKVTLGSAAQPCITTLPFFPKLKPEVMTLVGVHIRRNVLDKNKRTCGTVLEALKGFQARVNTIRVP